MMTGVVRLGWDVGGAHVKLAAFGKDGRLKAIRIAPCPIWRGEEHLATTLRTLRAGFEPGVPSAVTMTAEVADLWPDRHAGVIGTTALLVRELGNAPLALFAGPEGFVEPQDAAAHSATIASANWYATAAVLGHLLPEGVLLDIGSTTTDIIPFGKGRVAARGFTDAERLANNELIYTGVVRTAVMAMAESAPFDGRWVPLAAEFFATSADVHRLTGDLAEAADLHPAADNGPKTEEASARRLLRMVAQDLSAATRPRATRLARHLAEAQTTRIGRALDCVLSGLDFEPELVVGAGVGRLLSRRLAERRGAAYLDLGDVLTDEPALSQEAADCAPAVAVGLLSAALSS
ncbi:S-layer protein [Ancylobacter sp. 6x-1]|uniref:S-layer protein n=1 Tax=Ancylobacter crimeensis TaxID=2579147 RepID=A0ABT0D930_9HYPH|nr:hydantoinase/oxoprolinase family protein [Ancylobacter crimeensis]MCK0196307.1 S-layer protein [Ancylobacter crimeensis]